MPITPPLDRPDDASVLVKAALCAVDGLTEAELWRLTDADVTEVFAGLDTLRRRAEAVQVAVLAEASKRGLPDETGTRTSGKWAEQVSGGECEGAHKLAKRAHSLYLGAVAPEMGPTREAMLAGSVSGRQVDVIIDAVAKLTPPVCPAGTVGSDDLAATQRTLICTAVEEGYDQQKVTAKVVTAMMDRGADDRLRKDEAARDVARQLTVSTSPFSGMVHLDGTLTPDCGAALNAAIDALSSPRPSADGDPDMRSAAQRRHDGLQALCERAVAAEGFLQTTHGSPYRITVTVPHETFAATLNNDSTAGLVPGCLEPSETPLSTLTLQTLACSAEVLPVLVDGDGNPLDVADPVRLHTPRQRAAVIARDKHCTWPGCQAPPPWCDAHHVIWHSRGGPTTVENAALLCGYHHRHVHRTDQTATLEEGKVVWQKTTPENEEIRVRTKTPADKAVEALIRRWRARQA